MTTTPASTAVMTGRMKVRSSAATRRVYGATPMSRPVLGAPMATPAMRPLVGRSGVAVSCRVSSPTARRGALVLKLKVAVVAVVALVGVGVSTAEFVSWTQVDPAVDYVAGDPAWAHVTGR